MLNQYVVEHEKFADGQWFKTFGGAYQFALANPGKCKIRGIAGRWRFKTKFLWGRYA